MKSKIKALTLAVVVALTLTYTSCKKSDSSTLPDYTSQFSASSDDATNVSNTLDEVSNDATSQVENTHQMSGRVEGNNWLNSVCNVTPTYDSTTHTLTLTYNGNNCNNTRSRSGNITVQLVSPDNKWKTAGAQLVINFNSLKITRLSDGKSLVFNGTKTITNLNGGLVVNLASGVGTSVTHTIASSNMQITFDNGTTRNWSISKQRVFTYASGYVITETGTGTGGIAIQGTDRNGNAFTHTITQAFVMEETCFWQVVSGEVVFGKLARTLTVTLGLDSSGNPQTTCPGAGKFYYKAAWTDAKGNAHQVIGKY